MKPMIRLAAAIVLVTSALPAYAGPRGVAPTPTTAPPFKTIRVDGVRLPTTSIGQGGAMRADIRQLWGNQAPPPGTLRTAVTVTRRLGWQTADVRGDALRPLERASSHDDSMYVATGKKPVDAHASLQCVTCGADDPRRMPVIVREPLRFDGRPFFGERYKKQQVFGHGALSKDRQRAYVEMDGEVFVLTEHYGRPSRVSPGGWR